MYIEGFYLGYINTLDFKIFYKIKKQKWIINNNMYRVSDSSETNSAGFLVVLAT